MKKAAVTGAVTALGAFLAIWAAVKRPILDWPEVALIAGIALFSVGCVKAADIINNL